MKDQIYQKQKPKQMNRSLLLDNWLLLLLLVVCFTLGRYVLLAGFAWLCCYKPGLKRLQKFKIQPRPAARKQLRNELTYSLSTICIFALVGMVVSWLYKHGYTTIYTDVKEYGWL